MSESREAKRVRRIDLYTPLSASRSTSLDPASQTKLQAQLDQLYGGVVNSCNANDNSDNRINDAGGTDGQGEGGFEFRLFSTIAKRRASGDLGFVAQRVELRSPTPVMTGSGFIQPRRPDTYYFANKISAEKREEYGRAAIRGDDIRKGLEAKWPGFELPWRVQMICNGVSVSTSDAEQAHKKRKAGKKRRIVLRKRVVLEHARWAMEAKRKVEKEKAESDKRTRRNREKKVKRKEKEKAKKTSRVDDPA